MCFWMSFARWTSTGRPVQAGQSHSFGQFDDETPTHAPWYHSEHASQLIENPSSCGYSHTQLIPSPPSISSSARRFNGIVDGPGGGEAFIDMDSSADAASSSFRIAQTNGGGYWQRMDTKTSRVPSLDIHTQTFPLFLSYHHHPLPDHHLPFSLFTLPVVVCMLSSLKRRFERREAVDGGRGA